MNRLLSKIARWFITPADAASVVSRHGAQARALTLAERKAAMTARLRAELQQKGA